MHVSHSGIRVWCGWDRLSRYVGIGVLGVMLGACVALPVHESKLESTLPAKTEMIAVGRTDRTEVRQVLGDPILASDRWAFDLFRLSDWSGGLAVFVYVPIPVWSTVDGYVLVSYDASGKVAAYDKAICEMQRNVWIDAGPIGFVFDSSEDRSAVSVDALRRDEYLDTQRGSDRCTVLVSCVQSYCPKKVMIDGDKPLPLPQAQQWLAPLSVMPGPHRLQVPPNMYNTFQASVQFSCGAGDVVYATIETWEIGESGSGKGHAQRKAPLEGTIRLSRDRPEPFRERPMLIWGDGQWWVPQVP